MEHNRVEGAGDGIDEKVRIEIGKGFEAEKIKKQEVEAIVNRFLADSKTLLRELIVQNQIKIL